MGIGTQKGGVGISASAKILSKLGRFRLFQVL